MDGTNTISNRNVINENEKVPSVASSRWIVKGKRGHSNFNPHQVKCLKRAMEQAPFTDTTKKGCHDYWSNVRAIYRLQYPNHSVTDKQIRERGHFIKKHRDQCQVIDSSDESTEDTVEVTMKTIENYKHFVHLGQHALMTSKLMAKTTDLMETVGQGNLVSSDIDFNLKMLWIYVDASERYADGIRTRSSPDQTRENEWDQKSSNFGLFPNQYIENQQETIWSSADQRSAYDWFSKKLDILGDIREEEMAVSDTSRAFSTFSNIIDRVYKFNRKVRLVKQKYSNQNSWLTLVGQNKMTSNVTTIG